MNLTATESRRVSVRPNKYHRSQSRTGLTVLELLVCMGIVSVLMALLLPAVHSARESSRRLRCQNNLRQIGLALHHHHDCFGNLPCGWSQEAGDKLALGWATRILPWLEQSALQQEVAVTFKANSSALDTSDLTILNQSPSVFLCPSDSAAGVFQLYTETNEDPAILNSSQSPIVLTQLPHANYMGVFGTADPDELSNQKDGDGTFIAAQSIQFRDLTNGLSQVVVVSERTARRLPSTWLGFHQQGEDAAGRVLGFALAGPNLTNADECEFDSRHPGCINMLFADGHVRVISDSIESAVYQQLARRRD